MEAEKIEKLEKALSGFELIQGDVAKALANGEKIAPLAADLDNQRGEIEAVKAAMKASGETIPAVIEKRLSDIDRRLGRLNGPGGNGSDSTGSPVIEKSFGAQLTERLANDPSFREAAKSGKGSGRVELTGSTVREHYAVLEAVKARGMRATDEEMVLIAKAMLLSDNATITPIQRLPTILPMGGRRKFLSDIIPTQNVEVGTLEYLEYLGLGMGTPITATSVASTTTVATLTSTAHGARVGDRIKVSGATEAGYNGYFFVVTVPTADTLTYTIDAATADTTTGTILWQNLSTWGAAATVGENGVKPESVLHTQTTPAYIELIAHIFRVSRQLIDDVPGMQAAINSAGVRGLQELKEYKLLYGPGTSNTILGFMNKPGVQAYSQATTGDLGRWKAFRHTLTLLENVGAMPSAAGINPSDRELYDTSTDLAERFYMEGAPSSTGQPVFWSVPLISTRWIEPGKILIGDFAEGSLLLNRMGTQISFSESDGDDFKYNRLAMRFEERLGLAITRPEFFVKLTLTT